ncbi:MAG: hypothetical protein GXP15_08350 [Gammaproteobacteria bacterium]|nr:hypothetical protein [Gammaproteobacteria bacterium]
MNELINMLRTELRGTWRYRWVAMITAWTICLIGWVSVFAMPDIFEARAQVYVDADSRLADVMGEVGVAPTIGSRVFVVRQAMLGRPQLERVARETDLDLRAATAADREALLISLREKIGVSSGRTTQTEHLYTITFEDRDRNMAVAVVQQLLDTFVEDVLKLKEQGADDVSTYLADQLSYYAGLLSGAELRLATFKKEYVGLLPGENGGVFERLQQEMDLLRQERLDLQIEVDRRDELRRQLGSEIPYIVDDGSSTQSAGVPGSPTETTITGLEVKRSDLLLTFTERHPDVIAINEQLAQLYAKREADRAALANSASGMEGVANSTNPVYQSVQIALNESGVRIAGLRSQVVQREATVEQLNEQINTIPEVEAEYAELTRDYQQYRALYSELLLQKERERMGNVGEERDVVSFNVIDPPAAALEPIAPKRVLLLVGVLLLGIGGGVGLAFILHQMSPVFHDAHALRIASGRPILGVVSMTWLERHRTARRFDLSSVTFAGLGLVLVFVLTVIFQEPGVSMIQNIIRDMAS